MLSNSFHVFGPELFLSFSICLILPYCAFLQSKGNQVLRYTAKLVIGVAVLTWFAVYTQPLEQGYSSIRFFATDTFGNAMKLILLSFFILLVILLPAYFKDEEKDMQGNYEFPILMLLAIVGMFAMLTSQDFISLFLSIELQSLCLYPLAASKRGRISSLEAGVKYFVLGAFSSGILLLGISFLYGASGATNFEDIGYFLLGAEDLDPRLRYTVSAGAILVAVGLLFKLPAAPFHNWAPDVYSGAPTYVTAFFSIVPKIAILGVLVKLLYVTFNGFFDIWSPSLLFCSFLSLVVGALGALNSVDLKRFVAYSTINHVGFMLVALSSGYIFSSYAVVFYLIVYLVLNLNLFAIILAARTESGLRILNKISDFTRLRDSGDFLITLILTLNIFSMAGIPPLAGFFSKFLVIWVSILSGNFLYSIVIILVSVVSCFYYIRMIKITLFEAQTSREVLSLKDMGFGTASVIVATTLFNILLMFEANTIVGWCYRLIVVSGL